MTPTSDELEAWIGRQAVDASGEKVGKIADVYVDDSTGRAEWLLVTTGLFGTRTSFVPLTGAIRSDDDVVVTYDKATVKDSPNVDADGQLSAEEERSLYEHYGLDYSPRAPRSSAVDSEMQEAGSASIGDEVSPETALLRMRRSEAQALEDIEFGGSDLGDELGVERLKDDD